MWRYFFVDVKFFSIRLSLQAMAMNLKATITFLFLTE